MRVDGSPSTAAEGPLPGAFHQQPAAGGFEGHDEVSEAGVAFLGVFVHGAQNGGFGVFADGADKFARGMQPGFYVHPHGFFHSGGIEGHAAGDGVVHGGAEGIHVGPEILPTQGDALGGDVIGGADQSLGGASLTLAAGDAKVGELGFAVGVVEDVVGLEVAVNDAATSRSSLVSRAR
mgnify:CR=1 FL=1